jgi:hypothetical protein
MLSSFLRIKIVAAISAATAGTALAAQNAPQRVATPALRLERADTVGAQVVYTYAIYGGTAEKAGVESVRLDVSTPRGKYQPSILGVRGVFLMDALRDIEDSNIGHPPLFIGTPNGWFGAIVFTGGLDWLTDSPNGIRTKGVGPGEKLGPFILKSPALPAFRKWTVARNQPLPREEDQVLYWPGEGRSGPTNPPKEIPSYSGYILGPGWMREDVVVKYFLEQANIVCTSKWLEAASCSALRQIAQPLLAAEANGEDEAYLEQLSRARAAVAKAKSGSARLVLERTLLALAEKVPSKRPQPPGNKK